MKKTGVFCPFQFLLLNVCIIPFILLFVFCASLPCSKQYHKMDAALRREMRQPGNPDLVFIGACSHPVSDDERLVFSEYNIELRTVAGERFTAIGRKDMIQKLSRKTWIIHLELSKKVYPLKE